MKRLREKWTRGACGARFETLVWRRVDGGGAEPPPLKPLESTRPFGRLS